MKIFRSIVLSLSVLWAAASCGDPASQKPVPVIPGTVLLECDSEKLRCDGVDAVTFTVTVTDASGQQHDVTEYAEIYGKDSQIVVSGGKFSTDAEGEYTFYAVYGLSLSNEVVIRAVNEIPQLPEDPQETSTSFRHRMLLVQHTGTGCVNCPRMMESLRTLSEDPAYNTLYNHVASHSYDGGAGDAAYSEAARNLSMVYNTSGNYPSLTFNMTNVTVGTDLKEIKSQIDQFSKPTADAGIAASVSLSGNDILVNIEVKSAKKNDYRVAAWVLEDDIYSVQTGMYESWHNVHENALRYMAGAISQFSFVGEKVGNLEPGMKGQKMFVIPVEDNWDISNCEIMILVTAADENGNYDVANTAMCQIGDTVSYDYK